MSHPLRRLSLIAQVAQALREGIGTGRWKDRLPSEAKLCQEFQVGRITMRNALSELAAEGGVRLGGRGRHHTIITPPARAAHVPGRVFRMLTDISYGAWSSTDHLILKGITERLACANYRVEIEHLPSVYANWNTQTTASLARLDALPETAGWFLFHATPDIQRWFLLAGRPVVNIGKPPRDIALPATYPDAEAIGRHAAGQFHRLGHRNMVFICSEPAPHGTRTCGDAFVAQAQKLGSQAGIVTNSGTAESIHACLHRLLTARRRPTAFFTAADEIAIATLCHLLTAGLRVPRDASLLCAWDDFHLSMTHPPIARYHTDGVQLGRKAAKLALDMVQGRRTQPTYLATLPTLITTESLGPGPT